MKNTEAKKLTHEDFEGERKTQLLRQDRIECDPERHLVQFGDQTTASVIDFNAFGIAVESSGKLGDRYENAVMLVDGYPVSQVSISKVREENRLGTSWTTGFSIVGEPFDVDGMICVKDLNEILNKSSEQQTQDGELRPEFRLHVFEIKNILTSLEAEINGLSKNSFAHDLSAVNRFEDRIASRVAEYFSEKMSPMYQALEKSLNGVSGDLLKRHFEYFRTNVGKIMYQSAYANRAFQKPKGYAGDFEMMNHVYHRELRGESLFAKCVQRYFVDEPAGSAVRNREVYLRQKIKNLVAQTPPGKKLKILSVASGPAMEIQNLAGDPGFPLHQVEFFILDQDTDALKHAQRRIRESAMQTRRDVRLHALNLGIKQVINSGLDETDFDLIYSAGLFDYFTDPVAQFAAVRLASHLKEGGSLIIGNFGLNNPNQFAMGMIMDWNLIYRSEDKMHELFGKVGSHYKLEQEQRGINLFANIQK